MVVPGRSGSRRWLLPGHSLSYSCVRTPVCFRASEVRERREAAALFVRVFQASIAEGLEPQTREGTLQGIAGPTLCQKVAGPPAKGFRFPVAKAARTKKVACRRTTRSMFPQSTSMLERERDRAPGPRSPSGWPPSKWDPRRSTGPRGLDPRPVQAPRRNDFRQGPSGGPGRSTSRPSSRSQTPLHRRRPERIQDAGAPHRETVRCGSPSGGCE